MALKISGVIRYIMTTKRENCLSWDNYFMGVAKLSAQRSKDPSTQVGACIVNEDKRIIGTGYNGFPEGIDDDALPWEREGNFLDTKYAYVCHAEANAILNCVLKPRGCGCTLYVTMYPCNECAKLIIQSGIRKVVYLENKHKGTDSVTASEKMFNMAGVACKQFVTPF